MNILTPITCLKDVKELHMLGANEFYCGYVPDYWVEAFNKNITNERIVHYQVGINKKDVNVANIESIDEMIEISRYISSIGSELFVTVNAAFYPEIAYPILDRYFKELMELAIENLIVNDLGLLFYLHKNYNKFKITISCLSQVTNKYAVSLYKSFGVRRIVFPRHISCSEMIKVAEAFPEIEFEFFVLSGKCIYDDGYCRCHHDFGQLCTDTWESFLYDYSSENKNNKENRVAIEKARDEFRKWSLNVGSINMGCSLCALNTVKGINNICSVKIAGRGKADDIKKKMVLLTKKVIDISENREDIESIREVVKKSFIAQDGICDENRFCYMKGF